MNKKIILLSITLSVIVSTSLFLYSSDNFNKFSLKIPLVSSQTNKTINSLYGYIWSSGIGWISLNCKNNSSCSSSDYKVAVDALTGNLSGYAWSNNIGWIRFDPLPDISTNSYPSNPQHPAKIDFVNKTVSGQIRACSVFEDKTKCEGLLEKKYYSGDWDGWIKITDGVNDYAKIENGGITGWAWGDINVGWISLSGTIPGSNLTYGAKLLYCDYFYADPISIVLPNISTLHWQCQFADTCEIDNGIGKVNAQSGSIKIRPTQTTTYNLSCNGFGGSTNLSASVKVSQPAIRYREVRPGE